MFSFNSYNSYNSISCFTSFNSFNTIYLYIYLFYYMQLASFDQFINNIDTRLMSATLHQFN